MRKVYFGNANKQVWIPAPQSGMRADLSGRIVQNELLSGRTDITRSVAASRRFDASWLGSLNDPELEASLHTIKSFYEGVYGDGPFYWVDPYAAKTNLLPPHWAAPALCEKDWPAIASFQATEFLETESNSLDYPFKSARYQLGGSSAISSSRELTLIIPQGYSLHVGWHGSATGDAGLLVKRIARADGAVTEVKPAVIALSSANRTNAAISGDAYSMAKLSLYKGEGAADFRVAGIIAQILPSAESPATGGFLGGRGTSAIEFASQLGIEYYSANVNNGQVGMNVQWQEV